MQIAQVQRVCLTPLTSSNTGSSAPGTAAGSWPLLPLLEGGVGGGPSDGGMTRKHCKGGNGASMWRRENTERGIGTPKEERRGNERSRVKGARVSGYSGYLSHGYCRTRTKRKNGQSIQRTKTLHQNRPKPTPALLLQRFKRDVLSLSFSPQKHSICIVSGRQQVKSTPSYPPESNGKNERTKR